MYRILAIVFIIAAIWMTAAACSKKTIATEPYDSPSYPAEGGRQSTGGAETGISDQGRGVEEESLEAAGQRSRMSSAATAADREKFENQDVLFEFDSAVLSSTAQEILRGKARWLKANPDVAVIIEGHCDDRGTNEYNLALGERRARAALDFLASLGIDPSRLSTVSYGEERPLINDTSEGARARNRRAHFVIEL